MAYTFVDHLREYVRGLVAKRIAEESGLPTEFKGIPDERIITMVEDLATPILRKIEDEAVDAGIQRFAALVRYSKKQKGEG